MHLAYARRTASFHSEPAKEEIKKLRRCPKENARDKKNSSRALR
jgi:hypothetical protein